MSLSCQTCNDTCHSTYVAGVANCCLGAMVFNGFLQRSILELILFNICIKVLDDGTHSSVTILNWGGRKGGSFSPRGLHSEWSPQTGGIDW